MNRRSHVDPTAPPIPPSGLPASIFDHHETAKAILLCRRLRLIGQGLHEQHPHPLPTRRVLFDRFPVQLDLVSSSSSPQRRIVFNNNNNMPPSDAQPPPPPDSTISPIKRREAAAAAASTSAATSSPSRRRQQQQPKVDNAGSSGSSGGVSIPALRDPSHYEELSVIGNGKNG